MITLHTGKQETVLTVAAGNVPPLTFTLPLGLPGGGEFAATLLILRECMHHLKFSSIAWMGR